MKRVLFISSRPIYPILGGDQIRTVQQLEFLLDNPNYIVDVLYIFNNSKTEDLKSIYPSIRNVFKFRNSKFQSIIQTLRFCFNNLPLQVNYYFDPKIRQHIRNRHSEYDIVFCNNLRTAEYVRGLPNVSKYIDFVDAISMNYEKAKIHSKGIKKLIYSIDHKRLLKYEMTLLKEFDRFAIISEIDRNYLVKWQKYI